MIVAKSYRSRHSLICNDKLSTFIIYCKLFQLRTVPRIGIKCSCDVETSGKLQ